MVPGRGYAWVLVALGVVVHAFGGGVCAAPQGTSSASGPKLSAEEAFAFVVAGMRQERAKLVSARGSFTGSLSQKWREKPENDLAGPVHGFLALDRGKVRFDWTGPERIVDPGSVRPSSKPGHVVAQTVAGVATRRFADDLLRVSSWHSDDGIAVIVPSRSVKTRRPTRYVDVWGMTLFTELEKDREYPLEKVFDLLASFGKRPTARATGIGSPTWTLHWATEGDEVWRTTWNLAVDVESGFTPRRYWCETSLTETGQRTLQKRLAQGKGDLHSARLRDAAALLQPGAPKAVLEWENKTDWVRVNEVWMPLHHERRGFASPFSGVDVVEIWDFRWESVNQPVPESLFNYTTFDLPEDVAIQDTSRGQTVWVRPPRNPLHGTGARVVPRGLWPLALGVGSLAALVALALFLRHRQPPSKRA